MLNNITIKDFAIIDSVSLDFQEGFHVLTGETGAGKSIVIEAISMALGSRADTTYVRTGKDKAVIELCAEVNNPGLLKILDESGLRDENNLFIRREIHSGGKSICRVNGSAVSVTFLSNLCKNVADIHGQYDHQSLLDSASHLSLLDSYGRDKIQPVKQTVSKLYHRYSKIRKEIDQILNAKADSNRKKDFMEFELSEIESAMLLPKEDNDLNEQLLLQKNSEKLFSTFSEIYRLLYDQADSSHETMGKSTQLLENIKSFSKEYEAVAETLSDCFYRLDDIRAEIRRIRDSIIFSEDAINETQARIDLIDRLKKKYGKSIEEILIYKEEILNKLAQIEDSDIMLESLYEELDACQKELDTASLDLTALRTKAAERIEKDMENELKELNFKDTVLTVSISPLLENGKSVYTDSGTDQVEFLIVTNKGERPKPLNKIASGGEISRIMLAFKSILGSFDSIPTLIFDEIDSGISGTTASIVGKKMKQISKTHQVICITHLAQIAAFSNHHYGISKDDSGGRTVTFVKPLNREEKTQEVARLLGGLNVTETTLKNAEELISESFQ